jgi:ketosteroid isomerase-like protein
MKTRLLHGFTIVCLLTSLCFAVQTQTMQKSSQTDREFSKKIVDDYYDAWNSGSLANAGEYYAKDPDLVFYDVAPLKYQSWKEYEAGVQKLFLENYTSVKLIPADDLKISRRGSVVWTTLTFHLSGTAKDGKTLELDCRHTAIWERRSGKWVVVHEHVSTPLQSQTSQ